MALIVEGETKCGLCGKFILAGGDTVATPHFITGSSDRFYEYSDAAFHRSCFLSWKRRQGFIKRFNEAMEQCVSGNGRRLKMADNGSIAWVENNKSDPGQSQSGN
jgi:hypothetical protein